MAFSHTWDNTAPADTQAANLLGQDIRDLKTDIQQRMAAISGADAAKQNFESGFAGVVYFATDTAKIYRWSGTTWVDVTADFFSGRQMSFEGRATALSGACLATVPYQILGANRRVIISGFIKCAAGGLPSSVFMKLNGSVNLIATAAAPYGANSFLYFDACIYLQSLTLFDAFAKMTYCSTSGAIPTVSQGYTDQNNSLNFSATDMTIDLEDGTSSAVTIAYLQASVI